MSVRFNVYLGQSWLQCEKVDEVGALTADIAPRVGEFIEVRQSGQLILGYPVESVRHVFDKGKHALDVLCIDHTPVEFD